MVDPISEEFIESMRADLIRAYTKVYFEEYMGPYLYGPGNFEVYADESGEWQIRPAEGWKPPELRGIFNVGEEKE
jgi:hypothetical protein